MRLVPQNLFGRMALVLLATLLVGGLLSTGVNVFDRGHMFYRVTTLQVAQRIADITKVLDLANPRERIAIVARLSGPQLMISLSDVPQGVDVVQERRYATAFRKMLQHDLGPRWPVKVKLTRTAKGSADQAPFFVTESPDLLDQYLAPRLFYLAARGFSFVTHLRFHDGTWVTFSSRLPDEHITRLYVLFSKMLLMLLVASVILLTAIRRVTQPLKQLATGALRLGAHLDGPPIVETGPTEVRATARAFNIMQAQVTEYLRDRAYLMAALSHDLKTFITRLRLRAELLPESDHQARLVADLNEMGSMVNATLEYLQGMAHGQDVQELDVMALLESIRGDAEDLGYTVAIKGSALGTYRGNAQELRRCLMNLVDNAAKYGGDALLSIYDDGVRLRIIVRDHGPGIPNHELTRVFEPFYRLERSRNRESGGTGLGLSIARDIARAHRGDIDLKNADEGGLEAMLTLPR